MGQKQKLQKTNFRKEKKQAATGTPLPTAHWAYGG